MQKEVEATDKLDTTTYSILFEICKKYLDNIAWRFPAYCPDARGICAINYTAFSSYLKLEIPTLYRDFNDNITVPYKEFSQAEQYAFLDYFEFIAKNVKDMANRRFHPYYEHYDFEFNSNTHNMANEFVKEINNIFVRSGLLYQLNESSFELERIMQFSAIESVLNCKQKVNETGLKSLLIEAIDFFKSPSPNNRKIALEKIWDAFERLKTYYIAVDKKNSLKKIIDDMAHSNSDYIDFLMKNFYV